MNRLISNTLLGSLNQDYTNKIYLNKINSQFDDLLSSIINIKYYTECILEKDILNVNVYYNEDKYITIKVIPTIKDDRITYKINIKIPYNIQGDLFMYLSYIKVILFNESYSQESDFFSFYYLNYEATILVLSFLNL